jgi:DNA processing protein
MTGPRRASPGWPPAAYAAALACLPGVGPAWLVDVLAHHSPDRAWALVTTGELARPARQIARAGPPAAAWSETAPRFDVGGLWARCQRNGIQVTWPGAPGYPTAVAGGPSPAGVLFWAGDISTLERRPCVAVIGTRRCTPDGAAATYQLGYDLSSAGVCIVSGLALGIDGAAHAGALAAVRDQGGDGAKGGDVGSTVGVAASGVDVVYPRRHGALWREVVTLGAVVSETPPGWPAQAWRFPSRNRLIAGLARMVVVVECHASGGSWHTVEAALRRGVEVAALPGPVHSSASVGTNTMLHEGATPVRGAQDVIDALGLFERKAPAPARPSAIAHVTPRDRTASAQRPAPRTPAEARRPAPSAASGPLGALDVRVRAALSWRPLCLDEIVERSGLPAGAVVVALERLEEAGLAGAQAGWWVRKAQ